MSRDPTAWMWAQACEMLEQAERLHRSFFRAHPGPTSVRAWEPPIDVIETGDRLMITVVLPGVDAQSVKVIASGDLLMVSGERPLSIDPEHAIIHNLEIPYGHFERRIGLPQGRFRLEGVRHADGCLNIYFLKEG